MRNAVQDFIDGVPGVYEGIPSAAYHASGHVNKSFLDDVIEFSPRHAAYHRDNPKDQTPAMLIGSALHCRILEPDTFGERYAIAGQCEATKKDGERCGNSGILRCGGRWLCGIHAKGAEPEAVGELLTVEQAQAVEAMADAIRGVRAAAAFLDDPGENELTLCWRDRETGLTCKARVDAERADRWQAMGDIKTTECASTEAFTRSIGTFGYHRQAAFYIDGALALGMDVKHFAFLAVEKAAPYGVNLFRLMDEAVEAGRDQVRRALREVAQCVESGIWPGYGGEFVDITIPAWEMRKIIEAAAA